MRRLPEVMSADAGNEIVFGNYMTGVELLEAGFDAQVLSFSSTFGSDPL